jgi:hypothetical protein
MTPEQRAARAYQRYMDETPKAKQITTSVPELRLWMFSLRMFSLIADEIREAERLAYERAVKVAHDKAEELRALADKRRATGNRTTATIDARATELYSLAAAIRALSQPETPATPSTDEEVRAWCERVYRETGVTPALRAAYEFYKANYRGETPAEKTEGT